MKEIKAKKSKDELLKQPIIVKRSAPYNIFEEDGHSGGSWKVAYADFVTAMMTFFMLMWLLNTTPTQQLKAVATYFEPTIGFINQSGEGLQSKKNLGDNNEEAHEGRLEKGVVYGVKRTGSIVDISAPGMQVDVDEMDNQRFKMVQDELQKALKEDKTLSTVKESVIFEQSPEGLVIKLLDQDKDPMFESGNSNLKPYAKTLLLKILKLIQLSPNFIAISGYTDKNKEDPMAQYSNWELSSDRGNSTRRFLVANGLATDKISKIVAFADTAPLIIENPYDSRNRRVEITLLRNSIMPFYKLSAPKELLFSHP